VPDWWIKEAYRSSGFQIDPNYLAMILVAAIPLTYLFYLHSNNKLSKGYYLSCLLLFATGIFTSISRGGLLGLFFVLCCIFLKNTKKIIFIFVIFIMVLLFVNFAKEFYTERNTIKSTASGRVGLDSSAQSRLDFWSASLKLWAYHPVFGIGTNNFKSACAKELQLRGRYTEVHNIFLTFLCETGLVGFIIFLRILFLNFSAINKLLKAETIYKDFAGYLQVSLIGFLFCSLFSSTNGITMTWLLLSLPICLENAYYYEKQMKAI
jgi:O-antigen ligase